MTGTDIRNSPSGVLKPAGSGGITPPAGQIAGTTDNPLIVGITTSEDEELDIGDIPDGKFLKRVGTEVIGVEVDAGTPLATGTTLTDADVTLVTSERYVLPAGTLTGAHSATLTPGANGLGFELEIGTQGFNYTIKNGGAALGTLYTVLAGTKFAVWVSSDGTDLVNPTFMPLGAEPIP